MILIFFKKTLIFNLKICELISGDLIIISNINKQQA